VSACHSFHSVTIKFVWDVTSPNFVGRYQIFGEKRCFIFKLQANHPDFITTDSRNYLFSIVHQLLKFCHVTFKSVPRTITTWLLCEPVTQEEHYFRHAYGPESLYRDGSFKQCGKFNKILTLFIKINTILA
jgi:hypothetical protein